MKKHFFLLGFFFISLYTIAQNLTGNIRNEYNEPLMGANLIWLNSTTGTTSDFDGNFKLPKKSNQKLVASYLGYLSDTLSITQQTHINIVLKEDNNLNEVVITSKEKGTRINNKTSIKYEHLSKKELTKAACCDLSGCFQTQTTVQPQTTNLLTNAKELSILGLSGANTQVLIDGFPLIQGLAGTYGISSIPGTLVENISISKGANSILQGSESLSGQINVQLLDPDTADKLLINTYLNSFAEKQINSHLSFRGKKWRNATAIHLVLPANKIDNNNDDFLDLPLLTRYLGYTKFKYGREADWGWHTTIGGRFHHEKRIGGQKNFTEAQKGTSTNYGQVIHINQPEIWAKTGYRLNDTHNLTLYTAALFHEQKSYFGTTSYDAKQTNAYLNLQYDFNYKQHQLKAGITYRMLDLNEDLLFLENPTNKTYQGEYQKNENISGIFAENKLSLFDEKLDWTLGIRADYHNKHKLKWTPRTMLKYAITPNTTARANIGWSWRTFNLFSENIGLLASAKNIIIAENLNPEEGLNYGLNLTHNFEGNNISGFISLDYYQTRFRNQIWIDYDTDPNLVFVQNFDGKNKSEVFQVESLTNIGENLEIKLGYTNMNVFRNIDHKKQSVVFTPDYKIAGSVNYTFLKNFKADINAHFFGRKRLPDTQQNPIAYQRPNYSKQFGIFNGQLSYDKNQWNIYAGCENIFDYTQKDPIIANNDPFGPYFDTSVIWAPIRGREFFIGIKYRLKHK